MVYSSAIHFPIPLFQPDRSRWHIYPERAVSWPLHNMIDNAMCQDDVTDIMPCQYITLRIQVWFGRYPCLIGIYKQPCLQLSSRDVQRRCGKGNKQQGWYGLLYIKLQKPFSRSRNFKVEINLLLLQSPHRFTRIVHQKYQSCISSTSSFT